jgi:hypothetical protein
MISKIGLGFHFITLKAKTITWIINYKKRNCDFRYMDEVSSKVYSFMVPNFIY